MKKENVGIRQERKNKGIMKEGKRQKGKQNKNE